MEKRVGFVGILVEEPVRSAETVNRILSEHGSLILARMGLPQREGRSAAVITLVVEATTDEIGSLAGKLGGVAGVSVKSALCRSKGD